MTTRVARARRKAGGRLAADLDPGWDRLAAKRTATELGDDELASPWDVAPSLPPESDEEPRVELAPQGPILTAAPGVRDYVVGLVRRVFLPPPLGAGVRSVLFAGADGSRDASRASVACAELLAAHTSKRVCLVDTSVDVTAIGGSDQGTPQPFANVTKRLSRNLWIAAPGAAIELMRPEVARRQLTELCARFDYVILDAPAIDGGEASSPFASLVDGVILVIDENATRRDTAKNVSETLQSAGARLLGVVLANRRYPIPAAVYRLL